MPKGHWPGRNWTPDLLATVDELVSQGRSDTFIGKRIGRTATAVKVARKRHGIVGRTKVTLTSRKVAALLGIPCSKTVTRWIHQRNLSGRRNGRIWYISDEALQRFLEEPCYWHLWQPDRITDRDWREWATALRRNVRYLTTAEVGDRLAVNHQTVNSWIHKGVLPAVRRGNWLIRESDLEGFVPPYDRPRAGYKMPAPIPQPIAEGWAFETYGRFTAYRQPQEAGRA